VVQGLQPRSHALFSRKKGFAGLKALVDFRLKGVLTYCKSLLHFYQELMKSGICLWIPRILALILSS
jgi:hypothetical protein